MDKRVAFKMFLKRGCRKEYIRRHDQIWPELVELLGKSGVYDYSIFLDDDTNTLYAVQKQRGYVSSQDLGSNPIVKEWWAYMADLMETNPDNSPVTVMIDEVFYMK